MTETATGWPWRIAQGIGVAATLALLAGLVWRPEPSLGLLWNVVIPLVPASLLVSPLLWRNACPLATLNMASNGLGSRKRASPAWMTRANVVGIVLFAILVPARRFLFNGDGAALALTIAAVGVAALMMGLVFDGRAGFCNAICPVLPVERLYGQSPLLRIKRARCSTCAACGRACLDLSPKRTVLQVADRPGQVRWLYSSIGAFAAALPGFVLGYFTLADGPLTTAGQVYAWIAATFAVSYVGVLALVGALKPDYGKAMQTLAVVATALYYWFAAPAMAETLGASPAFGLVLRLLALALVAVWVRVALSRPVTLAARHDV